MWAGGGGAGGEEGAAGARTQNVGAAADMHNICLLEGQGWGVCVENIWDYASRREGDRGKRGKEQREQLQGEVETDTFNFITLLILCNILFFLHCFRLCNLI